MAGNNAAAKKTKIEQYLEMLRGYQIPDALFFRPAKVMTKAQARDCYLHYLAWNKFEIKDRDALFTLDAEGTLQLPDPDAKVYIWPPVIDGVVWLYLNTIDKKGNKSTARQAIGHLDARNVVFLTRLSTLMRWYGATTIYHIGFMFEASRNDCHGQGRACDFAGVGGDGWDVTVAQHWAGQPVTMPVDWVSPTGTKYQKGSKQADWPPFFKQTTYRLEPTNSYLDRTINPDLARQIFFSAYQHAITEGSDNDSGVMSDIGATSSKVLHPDHPTSNPDPAAKNGREAHWQHIHMQVGVTGTE
jgi:hypothetical protein